MDGKLQQQLIARNQRILGGARGGPGAVAIQCGDGWFDLIDVLCQQLQHDTEQAGAPQVLASQVKEKYGGLRFYADSGSDRQWAMIELAEALSERVCDACGAPGRCGRLQDGSIATRCNAHGPVEPDEAA